jgi:predicted N-acyltransferase
MEEIALLEGVAGIAREEWDALVGDGSPFLEWAFLASLEHAGCVGGDSGWEPRPLVLRRHGRLVAACPVYLKLHSEGEFVFDFAWADAAERAGLRYYPKLLIGVPFTPVAGARFLTLPGEDPVEVRALLAGALRELCLGNGLSSVHVNFCPEADATALAEHGFLPRVGFQYHWRNEGYASFDDFLARLRSKRRNQIQRERRSLAEAGITIATQIGDEIPDDVFPRLHPIYRSTIDRNPWGRPYLNARFFALLRERFRARLCIATARRGGPAGEIVAGTINVQKGDALYGRYWGALAEVRNLHFALCYYAGIEHCIAHGLARFEPGAGGDYKQVRGFDATPTWSAHFVAEPRLERAVARHLEQERERAQEAIGWLRERSALKEAATRVGTVGSEG